MSLYYKVGMRLHCLLHQLVVVIVPIPAVEEPPDGADDRPAHYEQDERVEAAADPEYGTRAAVAAIPAIATVPAVPTEQRRRHAGVDVDVRPARARGSQNKSEPELHQQIGRAHV